MKNFIPLLMLSLLLNYSVAQELKNYTCLVDRIDLEAFKSDRSIGVDGIIKSNGKYHPLSICQFGVLNHAAFLESGDSVYYQDFVNQYRYFQDTLKVDELFDGKGIGLPYRFKFWDLPAPWYSGMTQGYALSYLLRYFSLTQDSTALDLAQKVAYTLLQKQEDGGTISTTKEGFTWIEEYPNSKQSPQVLNGFINGFIGLKEYVDFFPQDTMAARILRETYEALINSLAYFDSGSWSNYNRANKSITNNYLRYQIFEMKHLYEIFEDSIFIEQMKIWSWMAHDKWVLRYAKTLKLPHYNPSEKARELANDLYGFMPADSLTILVFDSMRVTQFHSFNSLMDEIKQKKPWWKRKNKNETYYRFDSPKNEEVNYIKYRIDSLYPDEELSFYKIIGEEVVQIEEVSHFKDSLFKYYQFEEVSMNRLIVKSSVMRESRNDHFYFHNYKQFAEPYFIHFTTEEVELVEGVAYDFSLNSSNIEDISIFYRKSPQAKSVKSNKFMAKQRIEGKYVPQRTETYQFLVVAGWKHPLSMLGNLKIKMNQDMEIRPEKEIKKSLPNSSKP